MSLLQDYEEQVSEMVAEITKYIGLMQKTLGCEFREHCLTVDACLTEARELLELMGLEVQELNPEKRRSIGNKISCYQKELDRLRDEYQLAKVPKQQICVVELGKEPCDFDDFCISENQRQKLLENSERIERTGALLSEGFRAALETEMVGAEVLNSLSHQRNTLKQARTRLREANAYLGRSARTVNNIMLRALHEKAVLYGVGLFFMIAVIITFYLKFSPLMIFN